MSVSLESGFKAEQALRILQVSTTDIGGGAEQVAWNMFQAYQRDGHGAWLVVGHQKTQEPGIFTISKDGYRNGWARLWHNTADLILPLVGRVKGVGRIRDFLTYNIGQPGHWLETWCGHEDFDFPASWHLLDLPPEQPDILHFHNLHGEYFDLRALPWLSQQLPLIMTLHDAWLFSGHCAHSFNCESWKTGCGHCPDLSIYPAIRRDATAYNWQRKREIYAKSHFYVATPCQWLMQKVEQSILAPAIAESRVIPNGVDRSIFQPADKQSLRRALGIPQEAHVLLFMANGIRRNIWKDYQTMRTTVGLVAERMHGQNLLFIALGEDAPAERIGQAEIRFVPYEKDHKAVARYYQMADVYLHAAHVDTFPNTILEALACGTPVVATAVGGIPEQVKSLQSGSYNISDLSCYGINEATGILIPPRDPEVMALSIQQLLNNNDLRCCLGENAVKDVQRRFDLICQIEAYVAWYRRIIKHRKSKRLANPVC